MKFYQELDDAVILHLDSTEARTKEPFNDQYENTDTDHAKAYPAVYFELLEPVQWNQAGNQYQTAKVRGQLHCVVYDIKDSKVKIQEFAQQIFLQFHNVKLYDIEQRELTSEWVRVGSSKPKRYGNLKVIQIEFEFEGFDYSTLPTNLDGPITFNIEIIP